MNTYVGFDYGSTNVAVAVITDEGVRTNFIKFESKDSPFSIHMGIHSWLRWEVFRNPPMYPTYGFIESAFKGPNADTYKKMVRVGHSINVVMGNMAVECEYLDNNVWRKILFGKGNTKKDVAQEAAYAWWPQLLDLPKSQRGHCADALMIAAAGKKITEDTVNEQKAHQQSGSKEHK